MIATSNLAALLSRMTAAAQRLGEAQVQTRHLAKRDPARRWRRAALLWPLFTKG